MVRTALVTGIVLLISLAADAEAGDFKLGSEPDGFRGIKWGTNILTLTGMTRIGTDPGYDGGLEKYTRTGDGLDIGRAALSEIVYAFWRQQLFSVTIEATGSANCEALREATFKKYGFGRKTNLYLKDYCWLGSVTKMMYKKDATTRDCFLYMASQKLMEEATPHKRETAAEGTEKGF